MNKKTKVYEHSGKPCKTCGELYHYLTPSAVKSVNRAEKNRQEGKCSPIFADAKEAIAWLNDDHAKYLNGECVCGKKHNK